MRCRHNCLVADDGFFMVGRRRVSRSRSGRVARTPSHVPLLFLFFSVAFFMMLLLVSPSSKYRVPLLGRLSTQCKSRKRCGKRRRRERRRSRIDGESLVCATRSLRTAHPVLCTARLGL